MAAMGNSSKVQVLALAVLLQFVSHASGFAPGPFHGTALRSWLHRSYGASSSSAVRPLARPALVRTKMMLDPSHVDAFVSHAPMLGDSLHHAALNIVSDASDVNAHPVSFFDLAAQLPNDASLSPADETLTKMINAVDIGPGSESIQRVLSILINTPGIRQILQILVPPLSIVATDTIEIALPTYMKVLDTVSKTGGHEGLLPEGIDVTMKAVQRLASQGEIVRAFKVLQAAWPSTSLRQGAVLAGLLAFYILTPPGVFFGLFDIYVVSPIDKLLETKWSGRDFTIGKQLGGGNFGTVFEATLTDFGAMKLRGRRCVSNPEAS